MSKGLTFKVMGVIGLLLLFIPLGVAGGPRVQSELPLADIQANTTQWPQDYLEFLSQQDPRCQTLSEGGLLRLIKNNHPSKRIKYRLIRYFADVRQPGLVQGIIEPLSDPRQLGCTLVDGREQRWEIQTANFAD